MWSILDCCRGMWLKRRKLCSSCFKVSRRELMLLERRVKMNEDEWRLFHKKNSLLLGWGSLFSTVDVSYLMLVGMSPCMPPFVSLYLSLSIGGCCPPWCWCLCPLPMLFCPVSIHLPRICVLAFVGRLSAFVALSLAGLVAFVFGLCSLRPPALLAEVLAYWLLVIFAWTTLVLLSRLGVGIHPPLTCVFRVSLSPFWSPCFCPRCFLALGWWDRLWCVCGPYNLSP